MRPYTTGQAAKIAGVSLKTIIERCDAGDLRSWKVPGSNHRRIERIDLLLWALRSGVTVTRFGELSEVERAYCEQARAAGDRGEKGPA